MERNQAILIGLNSLVVEAVVVVVMEDNMLAIVIYILRNSVSSRRLMKF
jgi:hypothetical protein